MTAIAKVNRCDCHPETCCCQDYKVEVNGAFLIAGTESSCKKVAAAINAAAPPPSTLRAELEAIANWLDDGEERKFAIRDLRALITKHFPEEPK